MTSTEHRPYDVLCMGRSSIDLYAHEIGVPMTRVRSFDAYVGGCPTNVSVGTRRLGLRSALLTGLGADQVGDFVIDFLDREGVAIRTGHHCAQPLLERFGVDATCRASLAFYNTREEIDVLARALHGVAEVFG